MKIYAIFPDTLNNSMAIHDMPIASLMNAGILCEKQESFFNTTYKDVQVDDVVIMWIGSRDENRLKLYSDLNCRKLIRNIDSCSSERILFKRELELYERLGLEGLLVTYCTDYNIKFLSDRNINVIKYPHFLDFCKFSKLPDQVEKKFDIFISGHLSEKSYPMRYRLSRFFMERQNKYKVGFLQHPGYRLTNLTHRVYGQDYINLSSQSKLSIVCTGDDDALVVKYLEFAAALTLPIGDAPSNMPEAAKNKMLLISKTTSDKELEKLVDDLLSNNQLLKERTIEYSKIMKENFDISKTSDVLKKIFEKRYDNIV